MKWFSRLTISIGALLIIFFSYTLYDSTQSSSATLEEAEEFLNEAKKDFMKEKVKSEQSTSKQSNTNNIVNSNYQEKVNNYQVADQTTFGVLKIPKLDRSIAIIEGADDNALKQGVGHVKSTSLPNQNNQIVLSGHRDGVFRNFGKLQIGDRFIVAMPYGEFEYEIQKSKIVDQDDTSVIKSTDEEELVVSTCYPFRYVGPAPQRYVLYAYPVTK